MGKVIRGEGAVLVGGRDEPFQNVLYVCNVQEVAPQTGEVILY